jgi:hypothetical protein
MSIGNVEYNYIHFVCDRTGHSLEVTEVIVLCNKHATDRMNQDEDLVRVTHTKERCRDCLDSPTIPVDPEVIWKQAARLIVIDIATDAYDTLEETDIEKILQKFYDEALEEHGK